MEIIKGKYSGFCLGVNYTYKKAKEEIVKGKTYCLGEIIHNNQVIKELEGMGMITIDNIESINDNSRVIFRAHGEPLKNYEYAEKHNLEIIDLTCGRVKLIHNKVFKEKNNSFILIIGKKTHPEIIGTIGFSGDNYYVIENESNIKDAFIEFKKSKLNKVYVVSQTTFSNSLFDELVNKIKKVFNDTLIKIDKTICDATEKRQTEVFNLSKSCNKMIVIGSNNSSNTIELYNIAKDNCKDTYFVEDETNLNKIKFNKDDVVGVVAGASVPKYLIEKVIKYIE